MKVVSMLREIHAVALGGGRRTGARARNHHCATWSPCGQTGFFGEFDQKENALELPRVRLSCPTLLIRKTRIRTPASEHFLVSPHFAPALPTLIVSKTDCAQATRSIARRKRSKLASDISESRAATSASLAMSVRRTASSLAARHPMSVSANLLRTGRRSTVVEFIANKAMPFKRSRRATLRVGARRPCISMDYGGMRVRG
jgi:hypothetical protein